MAAFSKNIGIKEKLKINYLGANTYLEFLYRKIIIFLMLRFPNLAYDRVIQLLQH